MSLKLYILERGYNSDSNDLGDPDPQKRARFVAAALAVYRSLDEMCVRIFACADQNAVLAMISDHGTKPAL